MYSPGGPQGGPPGIPQYADMAGYGNGQAQASLYQEQQPFYQNTPPQNAYAAQSYNGYYPDDQTGAQWAGDQAYQPYQGQRRPSPEAKQPAPPKNEPQHITGSRPVPGWTTNAPAQPPM